MFFSVFSDFFRAFFDAIGYLFRAIADMMCQFVSTLKEDGRVAFIVIFGSLLFFLLFFFIRYFFDRNGDE